MDAKESNATVSVAVDADTKKLQAVLRAVSRHTLALAGELALIDSTFDEEEDVS
jgi:hypothetical protein